MLKNKLVALVMLSLSTGTFAAENEENEEKLDEQEITISIRMENLGYPTDRMSTPSYGLAVMSAQAVLREDGLTYHRRIEKILDDVETDDERAFFDGVAMYSKLKPSELRGIIDRSIEESAELFKGGNSKLDRAPHITDKFLAFFDKNSMFELLQALKDENGTTPFSLLMETEKRNMQAGFDGTAWLSVNSGYSTYGNNIAEVVDNLFSGQKMHDDRLIVSMEVLSADGNTEYSAQNSIKQNGVLMLSAENKQQNLVLIHLALRSGHPGKVTDFVTQILKSGLSTSEKVELLNAKDSEGVPGFFYSLFSGYPDVITDFAQHILNSDLNPSDKIQILSARDSEGISGFDEMREIKNNKSLKENAEAFVKVVDSSTLQPYEKDELISISKGAQTIIGRMQALNYEPNEGGMCYGLAAMAAQAVVRYDGQSYYDRVQNIKAEILPIGLDAELEEKAFFDGVFIYMNNFVDEQKGFSITNSQNIENPAKFFGGNIDDSKFAVPAVGLKFLAAFDQQSLTEFLEATRVENQDKPFSLLISYINHAVQIGFDGKHWLSVNHDTTKYGDNLEEAVKAVLTDEHFYYDKWIATIGILSLDSEIKTADLALIEHDGVFDFSKNYQRQNTTALDIALTSHHPDLLTNYTLQVLESNLDSLQKRNLLTQRSFLGEPLFVSMFKYSQNIPVDIAKTFLHQILESDLSETDKVELLNEKGTDGNAALYIAALNLSHELLNDILTAFTQKVLESDLSISSKVELLTAKGSDGSSWLNSVWYNSQIFKILTQQTLRSNLNTANKVELLNAYLTYMSDRFELLKLFEDEVSASELDQSAKNILLKKG